MKRALKWVGIVGLVLVVLLVAGVATAYFTSSSAQDETYDVEVEPVEVPDDPEAVAEGERLYQYRGCIDCHGEDGGGKVVMDAPPIKMVGTNLTKRAQEYSSADFARAIRHGIDRDGKSLVFMPSYEYYGLSDADLGRIIAYIRSLPPVERDPPKTEVRMLGRVLHTLGELPLLPAEKIDHDAPRPKAPEPGPTEAYGAYLASSCTGCHGEGLSGGPIPGAPPEKVGVPGNLTPHEQGLEGWTREDFFALMREGKRPDGDTVRKEWMPYQNLGRMTDTELEALWKHLQRVEPKPFGQR